MEKLVKKPITKSLLSMELGAVEEFNITRIETVKTIRQRHQTQCTKRWSIHMNKIKLIIEVMRIA